MVALSAAKTTKYSGTVSKWLARLCHMLKHMQELYGKLLHAASILPQGRAYLTGLESMLATIAKHPFIPHCPDKGIEEDLHWWLDRISSSSDIWTIHAQPPSLTLKHSQMPVLVLESVSSLVSSEEHGAFALTGPRTEEPRTLDGLRPSPSNSWSVLLMLFSTAHSTSSSSVTIPESLKDGKWVGTAIALSTQCSSISMLLSNICQSSTAHICDMSPVLTTQPISHPEDSMCPLTSCFLPLNCLSTFGSSSLMPLALSQCRSLGNSVRADTQHRHPAFSIASVPNRRKQNGPEQRPSSRISSSSMSSRTFDLSSLCFNSLLLSPTTLTLKSSSVAKPHPYQPNLHPLPSPNHPHCLAKDKLCLWKLANSSTCLAEGAPLAIVSEATLNYILEVIGASWADTVTSKTVTMFGTFVVYTI